MALGSTQPLVKMSTRNISWGVKATGAWGWRPHHLHVPNVMKICGPKPPGTLWAIPGLLRNCFFIVISKYIKIYQNISKHSKLIKLWNNNQTLLVKTHTSFCMRLKCNLLVSSLISIEVNIYGKVGVQYNSRTYSVCYNFFFQFYGFRDN